MPIRYASRQKWVESAERLGEITRLGQKYLPEKNNKCIFVRKVCLFLYWIESFVLISILSGMQLYVNNYPHEQIDF